MAAATRRLFVVFRFSSLFSLSIGLLLLPGCAKSDVQIGLGAGINASFSSATVLTGETVDITAVVTGTNNKLVVWSVCDGNGANCVQGGNSTVGTIMQIGTDSQGNSIARYTAPATVPAPPDCRAETSGCSVVLQGFLAAFNVSCFARVTVEPSTNPVPTITSLTPPDTIVGGAAFTLTVNGTNFIPSSVVRWDGSDRTTTFINSTQLQAAILASDIAAIGTAQVTVFNPPPDGGLSNAVAFAINNPVPALALLTPSTTLAGGATFTLTVDGSGFIPSGTAPGSVVQWNGSPRTTTFVNSTQVTADIPDTDIASVGTAMVTVVNPGPGGGTSNALTFTISTLNPVPVLTLLTPSTAVAGGGAFTLTVDGTDFISNSVVRWNGSDRTTTFINSTQLQAAIPAADIAVAGTAMVTAFNPGPGGGTSNALTFTINNPVPFIDTIVPSTVLVGGGDFTLDVFGGGYRSTSVVRVNGNDRATTFISNGELEAVVLAADIAAAGTAQVTVFNPAPGGGTSNMAVLNINNPAPALTLLTPSTAAAGGAAFTLTADGTGFIASSTVQWNGSNRTTMFVNSTQVTADIPASDIAATGTAMVTVVNPAPGGGTSNALTFSINPAVACAPGVVERVSVSSAGVQANGDSDFLPDVNQGGRFVAFVSLASNLVAGDTNGTEDVFLRDTCLGATGCTPSTTLISVGMGGAPANGLSFDPAMSASGRFVAFASEASNLVAGDTNGVQDVFVRDTCVGATGCTPTTIRAGAFEGSLPSFSPAISADGRFVAFATDSLFTTFDTNSTRDIYVHDTCFGATGCTPDTFPVSIAASGFAMGNGPSFTPPSVSSNGRFIAFLSDASDLVTGDTNSSSDIFVRDTCVGAIGCTPTTVRVSVAGNGAEGNNVSRQPAISATGRFVAFDSFATNLVGGDTNGSFDVFVHDRDADGNGTFDETGGIATVRVSVASDGTQGNVGATEPSISADGRLVVFNSDASNLVSADTNSATDVFLHNRDADGNGSFDETGAIATLLLSVTQGGVQGNGISEFSRISAGGAFVVFFSEGTNLVSGDTNAANDIFIAQTCVVP